MEIPSLIGLFKNQKKDNSVLDQIFKIFPKLKSNKKAKVLL